MLVAAIIGLQAATVVPTITVKPKDDGYRAEAGTFGSDQSAAVHSEIERHATDLCAGKQIKWGEFGSTTELGKHPGATPPRISGYYQEFGCIAASKTVDEPAAANWKPTPADQSDVERFFTVYFAKRDAGDAEAIAAVFEESARDYAQSAVQLRDFNRKLGPGRRRITGVTWYLNPAAAERPGIYAAIDFVGEYPTLHVYCGFIGLFRRGPRDYGIVREEHNLFERSATQPDPQHLATVRSGMCRGN